MSDVPHVLEQNSCWTNFTLSYTCIVITFEFLDSYSYYVSPFFPYQISKTVFERTKSEISTDILQPDAAVSSGFDAPKGNFVKKEGCHAGVCLGKLDLGSQSFLGKDNRSKSIPFEMYKRRTSVFVRRETFLDIACDALAEYKYVGPNQRADLVLACRYHIVSYFYWDYIFL